MIDFKHQKRTIARLFSNNLKKCKEDFLFQELLLFGHVFFRDAYTLAFFGIERKLTFDPSHFVLHEPTFCSRRLQL